MLIMLLAKQDKRMEVEGKEGENNDRYVHGVKAGDVWGRMARGW